MGNTLGETPNTLSPFEEVYAMILPPPKIRPSWVSEMINALDIATEGFRHMEAIGQHRLHNFLVGDTILLLGWATLFEVGNRPGADHQSERALVLVAFATLSALLSLLWTILGLRERKFLALQMEIVCNLEQTLETRFGDATLKITHLISELQKGCRVQLPVSGSTLKLNWSENKLKSRNLAVGGPIAFGVVSLFLLAVSIWWSAV